MPKPNKPHKKHTSGKKSKKQKPVKSKEVSQEMRLNKYIAHSGICSRREADMYISTGNVSVNGVTVTEMGYRVKPGDEVRFDGRVIKPEKLQYVLLNKPKNYITTVEDDRGRKTVMELIAGATKERLYPVGRLDRNTTGLLLFTNDGELAKKLTHPKHKVQKLYQVTLDKKLSQKHLNEIASPDFKVEGFPVYVDEISYIPSEPKNVVGIAIHSGRNRIVRKIFDSLGYKVTKLDRVVFAGLTKLNLSRGRWRFLTPLEISNLKML